MLSAKTKKLVTYCGLYCGDCPAYQGKIASLAQGFLGELKRANFKNFVAYLESKGAENAYRNYDQFSEVLGAIAQIQCYNLCRSKSGSARCKIRRCSIEMGFDGCWQCNNFENCDKMEFLKTVHVDAHIKNMRIIRKYGLQALIDGKRFW